MMAWGDEHDWKKYPELTNAEIEEYGFDSLHEQITQDFLAVVVKVHDGDTVTLRCDFRDFDFPLRLASIDAPELCTGVRGGDARDYLSGLLLNEEVCVRIDRFNRVEKWGRLLGEIEVGGILVSEEMVNAGHATPFNIRREGELEDFDSMSVKGKWF